MGQINVYTHFLNTEFRSHFLNKEFSFWAKQQIKAIESCHQRAGRVFPFVSGWWVSTGSWADWCERYFQGSCSQLIIILRSNHSWGVESNNYLSSVISKTLYRLKHVFYYVQHDVIVMILSCCIFLYVIVIIHILSNWKGQDAFQILLILISLLSQMTFSYCTCLHYSILSGTSVTAVHSDYTLTLLFDLCTALAALN